jgi:glutamine synthetase
LEEQIPLVEKLWTVHLDLCLEAGINVEGTNAEVAAGQWEFQTFAKGAQEAGDEMWVARYLLR